MESLRDISTGTAPTSLLTVGILALSLASGVIFYKLYNKSRGKKKDVYTIGILFLIIAFNINLWVFLIWFFKSGAVNQWSIFQDSEIIKTMQSPLHDEIQMIKYKKFEVPGFSFKNQEDALPLKNKEQDSSKKKQGQGQGQGQDESEEEDDTNFQCDTIKIQNKAPIEASEAFNLNRNSDLPHLRRQLLELSRSNDVYKLFFQDGEDELEESILKNKWFKFCGSAIWMSKYQVYFMVNRIVYTKLGQRNNPTISVLSAQIFDRNWAELKDYQFPVLDIRFPTILPHDIDVGTRDEKVVIGSEDPRIILKEYKDDESGKLMQEPIIVFNARRTKIKWSRGMHIYQPFSDLHKITLLFIEDKKRSFIEKNWAPFMDYDAGSNPSSSRSGSASGAASGSASGSGSDSNSNSDSINFIYNFNPLRIIKCDTNSGLCRKVSGPQFNQLDANDNAGKLRGGTNLVRIPSSILPELIKSNNRKYWFGIARSHSKNCGCLHELYRPHFFIMSRDLERESSYELNFVSSLVDFNINPETWLGDNRRTCSDGKSVLIPNSIAYWHTDQSGLGVFGGDDVETERKLDYMGITLSEADRTNKLIHVRGLLGYIQQALAGPEVERKKGEKKKGKKQEHEKGKESDYLFIENKLLAECSTSLSAQYCDASEKLLSW